MQWEEWTMNKEDIVSRPDFRHLVKAAITKYNLYPTIKSLRLDVEDFINDVAYSIWTRSLPKQDIEDTTFIYKKTYWLLGELKKNKNKQNYQKKQPVKKRVMDDLEDLGVRIKRANLSRLDMIVLKGMMRGDTLHETGQKIGRSGENVRKTRLKIIEKLKRGNV